MVDETSSAEQVDVDNDADSKVSESDNGSGSSSRQRSTIKFPYGDLEDAISVAEAIHDKYGGQCSDDQLAAALQQTTTSGAFRQKIATAQTFGVAERERGGVLRVTDLGARITDERTEAGARVEAFMNVPLYEALFESHEGGRLPSDAGLESEMKSLGVSEKQAARARQAFQRSAEQANMFNQGYDRLVIPPRQVSVTPPSGQSQHDERPQAAPTTSRSPGVTLQGVVDHPLIVGLWAMLPPPGEADFPPAKQKQWLEAARVNLALLYGYEEPVPAPRVEPTRTHPAPQPSAEEDVPF